MADVATAGLSVLPWLTSAVESNAGGRWTTGAGAAAGAGCGIVTYKINNNSNFFLKIKDMWLTGTLIGGVATLVTVTLTVTADAEGGGGDCNLGGGGCCWDCGCGWRGCTGGCWTAADGGVVYDCWGGGSAAGAGDGVGGAMDGGVGAGTGEAALSPFPIDRALGNSNLRAGAGVDANKTEPASEPYKI